MEDTPLKQKRTVLHTRERRGARNKRGHASRNNHWRSHVSEMHGDYAGRTGARPNGGEAAAVCSVPGRGSVFHVYPPVMPDRPQARREGPTEQPRATSAKRSSKM
ncbi:hypothetical protein KM043_011994 [Ampulex compressa]|nr:hypothetical protein KM043_011994 [Ampulex compressa]